MTATDELRDRTYAAFVFDWDGTAVPDRQADASEMRARVEELSAAGADIAVVSGTHVGNIDGQLSARPQGPGRLFLCLNRGSEVFAVDQNGPSLIWRRDATAQEDAALDDATRTVVDRLEAHGLKVEIVGARLNRRKIDLIPDPKWADPPKARIAELVDAVTKRLSPAGLDLPGVVTLATEVAREAGLTDPRVTSDAKHVEIGLTDKSDSMRWLLADFQSRGIGPGLVLIAGDEFAPLGGVRGSDDYLLVPEVDRAVAISVGVEPGGVPDHVNHLPGGPPRFLAFLEEQLARREARRVPEVDRDPAWVLALHDGPELVRVRAALATVANGRFGTRAIPEEEDSPYEDAVVVAQGAYRHNPDLGETLLPAPDWTRIELTDALPAGELLFDLRTGTLRRDAGTFHSLRFASLLHPNAMAMRAEAPESLLIRGADLVAPPGGRASSDDDRTWVVAESPLSAITAHASTLSHTAGGIRCVERLAAYTSVSSEEPADAGVLLDRLDDLGFESLLTEQRSAWAARWEAADIEIEGDPETQLAVRFALFHLMASVADKGESSVAARGLSGPAYAGHVFWDADVFVLPFLAATHPPAARAMLEYRIRRIAAARSAAASRGFQGARFPWESASTGEDVTPREGRTSSGTLVPIGTGEQEEHISADVAWAAVHYATWTSDTEFLYGPGAPLLLDTASYWRSRLESDGDGRLHLRRVIGPDEYHEDVDDNAFTNLMARWNLREAADLLERIHPGAVEANGLRETADRIVDGYDPATRRYEQFAGYFALEPLLVAAVAKPPVAADLLLGRARTQGSQIIKQADVLMAHHLIPDETAKDSLHPNLDFYLPRTAHGSSLSPAIYASLLARAGRPDEALTLLRLACRVDLDDLTGTTAGGLHLATMGGVWQAIVFGFAGVRPTGDGLLIDPVLPSEWERLTIRLRHRSNPIKLSITHDTIEVVCTAPLRLLVAETERIITPPGETFTFDHRSGRNVTKENLK